MAVGLKDDLDRCDREIAYFTAGDPDYPEWPSWLYMLGLTDWLAERELILEEMKMAGICPECYIEEGSGHLSTCTANGPRGRLTEGHHRICTKAFEIMRAKNHDYASDEDPFRNFRSFGRFGILVRLSDKLARLQSFLENGKLKVADETIEDTVCDIINYAILFQQYEEK